MDTHGTSNTQFPVPKMRQYPTVRDPRYPTVKRWLEDRAKNDRSHRQTTGFTFSPNEVKAYARVGEYLNNQVDITEALK